MLQNRMEKIEYHTPKGVRKETRVQKSDVRPRSERLKQIEGWYDVVGIPDQIADLHQEYLQSGVSLKFTRWLLRKGLTQTEVSAIGKLLTTVSVKISCKHNDLVRLGDTYHYKSCLKMSYAGQQLQYLADPDIAVAFILDESGKFVWRVVLRLVQDNGGAFALVHYRVYGNGPTEPIMKMLSKRTGLKIYKALDIKLDINWVEQSLRPKEEQFPILYSPTVHNNPWLQQPIWTDHRVGFTRKNKIWIRVHAEPY